MSRVLANRVAQIKQRQFQETLRRTTPPPRPAQAARRQAGRLLAESLARAAVDTAAMQKRSGAVRVRSAATPNINVTMEHPWVFARAGVSDWIFNPGLGNLGAAGPNPLVQVIAAANANLAAVMPGPVKAAIDASPLTSAQKKALKKEPLSFFIILADFSADTLHAFIKRVQESPGAKITYRIGGRTLTIRNRKGQNPALTAAEFLTVCNQNPISAARIAAQMAYELGVDAPIQMTTAAGRSAIENIARTGSSISRGVQTTAENIARTGSNISRGVQTTAKNISKGAQDLASQAGKQSGKFIEDVKDFLPFFGLGDAGVVSGPAAGAATGAAAAGTTAAAGGVTTAQVVGLVTAAVSLASVLVPPLLAVAAGQSPGGVTQEQANQAAQDAGGKFQQAKSQIPEEIQQQVESQDKVLGMPRSLAYGLGVATLAVGGLVAFNQFKR